MRFNSNGIDEVTYDAIVVGSGISGGWAAKELCEGGLKTLVLERGRDVKHIVDYTTANLEEWEVPNRGRLSLKELDEYQKQKRPGYTLNHFTKQWWVKDTEHPYTEVQPFDWIRGYHVGGRSLLWGRQSYRLGDLDFEANVKDGVAIDWPIRYADIAPWYDLVERFIGVSGQKEGLHQLPDGHFQPPMEMTCIESGVKEKIAEKFNGRVLTIGRTANLTQSKDTRGACQFRDRCIRGCPYGAYFSSQSSTLPAAVATGNLTLKPNSVVTEIIFDSESKKAKGVRILDAETGSAQEYFSKVVFLCGSTIGSTWIMLHSKSDRFPDGFGNDSGELGHNLMDHVLGTGAFGISDDFGDKYYKGRRPNGIYVPRFRNIDKNSTRKDFLRGYGYQGGGSRGVLWRSAEEMKIGLDLKEELSQPGPWNMSLGGFGECLPYHENMMYLNEEVKDKHGLPTVTFDAGWKENEIVMRKDMEQAAMEMLEAAGLRNVRSYSYNANPGHGIHEMGTARMGLDPKTSVLNKWNQVHAAKNVYVTDGACMTSAGCQNPSLTYMALTARAANHAIEELKKNNI